MVSYDPTDASSPFYEPSLDPLSKKQAPGIYASSLVAPPPELPFDQEAFRHDAGIASAGVAGNLGEYQPNAAINGPVTGETYVDRSNYSQQIPSQLYTESPGGLSYADIARYSGNGRNALETPPLPAGQGVTYELIDPFGPQSPEESLGTRKIVQDALGSVGRRIPFPDVSGGIRRPSVSVGNLENEARFLGGFAPDTLGEFAIEALPGIGMGPGVGSAALKATDLFGDVARAGVRGTARQVSGRAGTEAALAGLERGVPITEPPPLGMGIPTGQGPKIPDDLSQEAGATARSATGSEQTATLPAAETVQTPPGPLAVRPDPENPGWYHVTDSKGNTKVVHRSELDKARVAEESPRTVPTPKTDLERQLEQSLAAAKKGALPKAETATLAEMKQVLIDAGQSTEGTPSQVISRYRGLQAELKGGIGTPTENVSNEARRVYENVLEQTGDPEAARLAARKAAAQETEANTRAGEMVRKMDEAARARFGDAAVDGLPPISGGAKKIVPLNDAQTRALANFTDMTKGVIEDQGMIAKAYDAIRPVTATISGDVQNSKIAELIAREMELRTLLTRLGDMKSADLNKVTKDWREGMLKRYFQGPEYKKAADVLSERGTKLFQDASPSTFDAVQETLRTAMLSADLSVFGQNLEAAVRRGAVPMGIGVLRDTAERIATKMHLPGVLNVYGRNDIDHVSQALADGLIMGGGKTVDVNPRQGLFGRIPFVGKKVEAGLDKLAEVQYQDILGTARLRAYEGLLIENKILNKLTLGKFGGDIAEPTVRRRIADHANTIGSTSRTATGATRAAIESKSILSPRMTRAQINEVLLPMKTLRSTEDAINTLNLLASYVVMLGTAKAMNDQFGITDFVWDPLEFGFGQITLPSETSSGKKHVVDLLPQASFAKALLRTVGAYKDEDWERLAETWERYAFGRSNVLPAAAGRFAGYGYNAEGKFTGLGDERMSLKEAVNSSLPLPLSMQDIIRGERDPLSIIFGVTGQSAFPESSYGTEDRIAQEIFGKPYKELGVLDQAKVHREFDKEGVEIDDWGRAGPYFGADDRAFDILKAQTPQLERFATLDDFRNAAMKAFAAEGASLQEQRAALQKMEAALGLSDLALAVKKGVIATDPSIIDALQKLYEKGELTFPPSKELTEFAAEQKVRVAQ